MLRGYKFHCFQPTGAQRADRTTVTNYFSHLQAGVTPLLLMAYWPLDESRRTYSFNLGPSYCSGHCDSQKSNTVLPVRLHSIFSFLFAHLSLGLLPGHPDQILLYLLSLEPVRRSLLWTTWTIIYSQLLMSNCACTRLKCTVLFITVFYINTLFCLILLFCLVLPASGFCGNYPRQLFTTIVPLAIIPCLMFITYSFMIFGIHSLSCIHIANFKLNINLCLFIWLILVHNIWHLQTKLDMSDNGHGSRTNKSA